MRRKELSLVILLVVISVAVAACGNGDSTGNAEGNESVDYPTRPIEIIAGGGPGGGTDTFSRGIGRELSEILGVEVNVVNQPGAAGAVASQELASRPADGYAIMPTTSDFQINIASGDTKNYLEQFAPLARIHEDTYALWVKKNSEYADIETLIQKAKESPEQIVIGGTGSEGLDELTVQQFEKEADIELNYTSYEDSGRFQTDLVGGHIDVFIDEIGPAIGLYESGEIEPLVVFAKERLDDFPEIPTTMEKGIEVTNGMSRGFMIKKNVPDEIRAILEDALKEAQSTDRYQKSAEDQYLHLKDGWLPSDKYRKFLETEIEEFSSQFNEGNNTGKK